ncbi:Zinc finger, CHC2-type [uncultured Caudovirales phage]|uniref:Zinc finger, CHC2-type n=1 Tax=uncultured Caudovirales phage TaxID=2100421 RepID=A0A6J5QVU5_9CAUD|nr:Zinc finger, CHC2-type [uncultured Caudovirales phage]
MTELPFAAVKAASPSFVDAFCLRYLPGAKKHGSWWKAKVPWRADKNPSLGVHESGHWKDFSRSDKGDLIDLFARLEGCSNIEAVQRLAAMMGVRV